MIASGEVINQQSDFLNSQIQRLGEELQAKEANNLEAIESVIKESVQTKQELAEKNNQLRRDVRGLESRVETKQMELDRLIQQLRDVPRRTNSSVPQSPSPTNTKRVDYQPPAPRRLLSIQHRCGCRSKVLQHSDGSIQMQTDHHTGNITIRDLPVVNREPSLGFAYYHGMGKQAYLAKDANGNMQVVIK